jgi:hypothetical protein
MGLDVGVTKKLSSLYFTAPLLSSETSRAPFLCKFSSYLKPRPTVCYKRKKTRRHKTLLIPHIRVQRCTQVAKKSSHPYEVCFTLL